MPYRVQITLTNESEGHRFSEFTEDTAQWWSEPETVGELYRELQREYGVCRSRVYVDTTTGAKAIGWYFESRQRYEDTGDPYLRGAWTAYEEYTPEEDGPGEDVWCDRCMGTGEQFSCVKCTQCHGTGVTREEDASAA